MCKLAPSAGGCVGGGGGWRHVSQREEYCAAGRGGSGFCWIYLRPRPLSVLRRPSPSPSEGLPPLLGAPLQCNWLWQPHTWQQCG